MTFLGIFENLLSELLSWLILFGIGIIIVSLTKKPKLLKFFKVSNTKCLVIYLSKIRVSPFGSIGIDGQKFSFEGETVSQKEMQVGYRIKNLFTFLIPELAENIKLIGKLFYSDVSVELTASPLDKSEIDTQSTIIALGSSAYNLAAKYIEDLPSNIIKFRYGKSTLEQLKNITSASPILGADTDHPGPQDFSESKSNPSFTTSSTNTTVNVHNPKIFKELNSVRQNEIYPSAIFIDGIEQPITDTKNSFIERIVDENKDRSLFLIAGLSEHATIGAANFLLENWPKLLHDYKSDQSFLIMLRIDDFDSTSWTVLFEKKIIQYV